MDNNIIKSKDIFKYSEFSGNKALNLKKCLDMGFCVPEFVVLPSSVSEKLFSDNDLRRKIVQEIRDGLKCEKYIVRSNAFIEDGKKMSAAGIFLTKANISLDELAEAIHAVLKQAYGICDLKKFSIIVQEYIESDIAGVAFTRGPNGGREMVVEYAYVAGEKTVGGETKPFRSSFYWQEPISRGLLRLFSKADINGFKKIEKEFNFPQDIEWCIKDNKFYLLQSRPISTISDKQYKEILFLEKYLLQKGGYYFEKTEASEIAPRPARFTFDLLRSIYRQDGPISKVYKKYGIDYKNTDFLKVIGNELYVDKEKEIQSLLPAYTYLKNKYFLPRIVFSSKIIATVRNLFFINKIFSVDHDVFFRELKFKIEESVETKELKDAVDRFMRDYELIFEINLLLGIYTKRLRSAMGESDNMFFLKILSGACPFGDINKYHISTPSGIKGNSIDILDESDLVVAFSDKKTADSDLELWWRGLSEDRKKTLKNKIEQVIIFHHLREWGRWLVIKNINIIRDLLLDRAIKSDFKNERDVYFVSLKEALNNDLQEAICLERRHDYEKYDIFNLPNVLFSSFVDRRSDVYGVSSGFAEGVLRTLTDLDQGKNKNEKIILYTEILSPDLVKYFDGVSGIISDKGGLLSHLAILARERNIPVVVGLSLLKGDIRIGDRVKMNGNTGEVSKL